MSACSRCREKACPPDARPPGRRDGRCRGQARLRADAVDPRAAYPAREGDVEHLHQLGAVRAGFLDPHDPARREGPAAAGRGQSRARGRGRRPAGRDPGRRAGQRQLSSTNSRCSCRSRRGRRSTRWSRRACSAACRSAGSIRAASARQRAGRRGHRNRHATTDIDAFEAALKEVLHDRSTRAGWRPTAPADAAGEARDRHRQSRADARRAADLRDRRHRDDRRRFRRRRKAAPIAPRRSCTRTRRSALPGLSEPQTVRHYTRLSAGRIMRSTSACSRSASCTMKHNPRLNEKIARLPGFADIHPLQPNETVQGAIELINELAFWLLDLTGMHGVAMSPKAGAHGELCGLLCIRAALEARGDARAGRARPRKRARHQSCDRGLRRLPGREYPGDPRGPGRSRRAQGAARARRRGGDDHQPQHLRPVRARHEGDLATRSTPRAGSSIATAPISTPSSARSARATSASTRCTSTSTRPSRPRMAAAVRGPDQ